MEGEGGKPVSTRGDDVYILTGAEERLLGVLCNPEFRAKTVTAKCKEARVSRDIYYAATKKQGFLLALRDAQIGVVQAMVSDVVKATYHYALTEARCHQDRRIILEMAGLYREVTRQELAGPGGGPITFATRAAAMSDEELAVALEALSETRPDLPGDPEVLQLAGPGSAAREAAAGGPDHLDHLEEED